MTTKTGNAPGEHPLFRAMVVMGGSLAVGCGGTVVTADSKSGPHGTSGNGGSGGVGGATILIDGGAGASSVGGSAGQAEPVIECTAAQWDCSGIYPSCLGVGLQKPVGCSCDPTRPKSIADCTASEVFVCRQATADGNGQPLAQDVLFNCACLPRADSCSETCKALDPSMHADGYDCNEFDGIPQSILCGCGFVYLR